MKEGSIPRPVQARLHGMEEHVQDSTVQRDTCFTLAHAPANRLVSDLLSLGSHSSRNCQELSPAYCYKSSDGPSRGRLLPSCNVPLDNLVLSLGGANAYLDIFFQLPLSLVLSPAY